MIQFPENAKKHLCSVLHNFGPSVLHEVKNTCESMLMLLKVDCRMACSFTQSNTQLQVMQIVPNPKQHTFSSCFGLFFPSFLKTRIFPDIQFSQNENASLIFSFYTNSSYSKNSIFVKNFPCLSIYQHAKIEKQ